MSDSREEIAQAIRESMLDDYREGTEMTERKHILNDDDCWNARRAQGNLGAHAPACYGEGTPVDAAAVASHERMVRGHVFPDALKPGNATAEALRGLYLAIREACDSGVLDLDELSLNDNALANRIFEAMRVAEAPLVESFGPQTVK